MALSNYAQFTLLLYSLLAGIITGVLFDIYRIIRGFKIPNKIIGFMEDILFWVLASLLIFTFLYIKTGAFFNMYVYIFISIGMYLYFKILSGILLKIENNVLNNTFRIIRILFNMLIYPFKLVVQYFFQKY